MATITTINENDYPADSRAVINTNLTNLNTDKAELASPTFTGTPTLPTGTIAVTQSAADNSTKVATTAYVDLAASPVVVETTSGTTHSLTTTAGQKVVVLVKGRINDRGGSIPTVTLKYNAVTKDTNVTGAGGAVGDNFALMYTETPGAATQNITVETSIGSVNEVVIIVMKIG